MNNRQPTNYQSNPYDDRGEDSYGPPAGGLPSRPAGGMAAADILEQCTQIDRAISDIESRLQNFKGLQSRILSDRAAITDLDGASSDLMTQYRNLAARMKKIKSDPDSGSPRNVAQVGRVDRRLKSAINEFQRLESDFRSQMRDQQARQYRIVNPNATEEEVREVVEDPNAQVFQQAVCYPCPLDEFSIFSRYTIAPQLRSSWTIPKRHQCRPTTSRSHSKH
jgi:syntaxin 1B/2/3